MDGLRTTGFHHTTMVSGDAQRTVRFYRDLLGLGLVKRTASGEDPSSHHLYFGDDDGRPGTLLNLVERPGGRRGGWGVGGVHHLALGVSTEEALLKWKRRLTDGRVRVSGPYDRGYFTSLYFSDPDGQILEIATAGPGYAVDEPADALGQELVLPSPDLLRGNRDEAAIAARTWPEPVPMVTPDMRLDGIHHISGITDDLDLAVDWYPAVLGLELIKRTVNRDDARAHHYFWGAYDGERVAPHSSYTLFGWPGSTYRARPGVGQTHHVAFRAESREQQEAWRDHLLRLDVEVGEVVDRHYFTSLFFRAPDGMLLELATDGPGLLLGEEPEREDEPALAPIT